MSTCVSAVYNGDAKSLGGSGGFSNGPLLLTCKIDTSALSNPFQVTSISVNFLANNGDTTTYKLGCYTDVGDEPDALISYCNDIVWDGTTGTIDTAMLTTPDITNTGQIWLSIAITNTGVYGPDTQATTTGLSSGDSFYQLDQFNAWFPTTHPKDTGTSPPNCFIKLCATTGVTPPVSTGTFFPPPPAYVRI